MLKTLIGGLYSGSLWDDIDSMKGHPPPLEWLEILYRGQEFPASQGLYWLPTEMPGLSLGDRDEFEVLPWLSGHPPDQQIVVGLHVWFFSFHFALLAANAPPGSVGDHYRTAGLRVDGCEKRIEFKWRCGPHSPEITLGWPSVQVRLPMADQRKPDNADIIRMRDALRVFQEELGGLIRSKLNPPPAGSQAAAELATSPDRAEEIGMALDHGVVLLESAAENLSLFAKRLDEPAEPIGCLLNVRGVLEACAVAVWLLDPAIIATDRMRRGMGRRIEGLDELRKFAQAAGADDMIAHALARLDHARQNLPLSASNPRRFPDLPRSSNGC